MDTRNKPVINVSYSYNPLEETLEYELKKKAVFIGIPKENSISGKQDRADPSGRGCDCK